MAAKSRTKYGIISALVVLYDTHKVPGAAEGKRHSLQRWPRSSTRREQMARPTQTLGPGSESQGCHEARRGPQRHGSMLGPLPQGKGGGQTESAWPLQTSGRESIGQE